MEFKKIALFAMILLLGLTVVTAADLTDEDSAVAVETPQVEQQVNTEPIAQDVQTEQNNNLQDEEPSNDVVISSDVTIDSSNVNDYNNKKWIVNQGVTVTGTSGVPLSNVAIKVAGNQVTLKDLQITSQDISDYIINVTSVNNFRIDNSQLTITNVNNIPTMGIYIKDADTAIINGTTLTVNAPAQAQQWYNTTPVDWYSVLEVSGVYSDHSNNVKLENSTITITNTTENLVGTTMPAVTVKNNSNVVSIKNNTISSTGAQYVYGVMMNDLATNVDIINNTVSVSGLYYVAGIDASTASNSKVSKNKVTAISENATTFPDGYESLAYGIISDTYSSGNTGNHICQNNITISAIVCYGVEMYRGMNNFICSNKVVATGNRVMGVAIAFTNNTKIINNNMSLTGNNGGYHYFYEEITPVNTGIIFTNQSNGNWIQGNGVSITALGYEGISAINIQNSTTATITGNDLFAKNDTKAFTENDAIKTDSLCSDITIGTNDGVVLYNCNCGCMSNNNNGASETESISEAKFAYTKNIKKDNAVLIIDDSNYQNYGSYKASQKIYKLDLTKFVEKTDVIFNLSIATDIYSNKNATYDKINLIAVYYSGESPQVLYYFFTNVSNFYGPNAILGFQYPDTHIINSTVYGITSEGSFLAENNTIYNRIENLNKPNLTFRNNYLVKYNPTIPELVCGIDTTNVHETSIFENNGPNYENPQILNNSNYNTYFNEDNTLKTEYENSVLFAVENITNPVIINAPVTLTAFRGIGGYSTVNFIEGSDNSVIEDSFINKVTLTGLSNIKVNNNKLLSDDSVIEVAGTLNSIIENNTINTKNTYTVTFDEDSFGNIVRNNELFASELTGDDSVQTTDDNTVESNLPIPIPELKIDTTEFTAGQTATIQASIYLGKKVASDINAGKVVFKVNGKTLKNAEGKVIYAKVAGGVAKIDDYEVPASWTNDTVITAVYSGSNKCEALNTTASITITKNEPTITTEDITAAKASTITLSATVKDGDKAITTGKVVFKINGKTVKDTNGKVIYATVDANGVATIPDYTLPESMKTGTYTITAVFTAPNYEKLNTTSTLTITA